MGLLLDLIVFGVRVRISHTWINLARVRVSHT
jgi:hypothetical protein